MEDKVLLNIAMITTLLGITALLVMSYTDTIPEKGFNEITSKDVNLRVKANGTITQIYIHNNSLTLKVKQECIMDVFLFEKNISLQVGDNINLIGTVQEYNGKMEIMADKITEMKIK